MLIWIPKILEAKMKYQKVSRGIIESAFAVVVACSMLVGCGKDVAGPTLVDPSPVATPTPAPVQVVARLAIAARQGGNVISEADADTFFVLEAGAVCLDSTLDCPRLNQVQWTASGAFCEFFSDINAAQVKAKCFGGGVGRFEAYSREHKANGILQLKINIPSE
jgi:hypothetical protein